MKMKKLNGWLFFVSVSMFLCFSVSAQTQNPKTKIEVAQQTIAIDVADLRNRYSGSGYGYSYYDSDTYNTYSERSTVLGELIRSRVMAAFAKDNTYRVVDWQGLPQVEGMKDRMHRSSQFDQETVVKSGRQIGVRRLVRVEVTFYSLKSVFSVGRNSFSGLGTEARLTKVTEILKGNAWITDTKTGLVQAPVNIEASHGSLLTALRIPQRGRFFPQGHVDAAFQSFSAGGAVDKFGDRVADLIRGADPGVEEFAARLKVVEVENGQIFLNQGSKHGIKKGDRYLVPAGKPLYDTESDRVIGSTKYIEITVEQVLEHRSIARITAGEGTVPKDAEVVPFSEGLAPPDQLTDPKGKEQGAYGAMVEPPKNDLPERRTITIRLLTGSTGSGRGVIYEDSNNSGGYDDSDKVLSYIKVIEVKGDLITCEILNPDYRPAGGQAVWFFE